MSELPTCLSVIATTRSPDFSVRVELVVQLVLDFAGSTTKCECRGEASISKRLPLIRVVRRRDYIAKNLYLIRH
jgi:hypothetical protein